MLKFKNSEERHLFWMQGSDEEKDAEVLKKVRKIFWRSNSTVTCECQVIILLFRGSVHSLSSFWQITLKI